MLQKHPKVQQVFHPSIKEHMNYTIIKIKQVVIQG